MPVEPGLRAAAMDPGGTSSEEVLPVPEEADDMWSFLRTVNCLGPGGAPASPPAPAAAAALATVLVRLAASAEDDGRQGAGGSAADARGGWRRWRYASAAARLRSDASLRAVAIISAAGRRVLVEPMEGRRGGPGDAAAATRPPARDGHMTRTASCM